MLLLTCPIYFLFLSNIPPLIHLSALIFAMLIYANMLSLDCSTFRPVKLGVFNRCLFATMINPIYSIIVYIVTQLHTTSTVKCILLATWLSHMMVMWQFFLVGNILNQKMIEVQKAIKKKRTHFKICKKGLKWRKLFKI